MPVKSIIENVPTNIIFGFLGAGKTTAILDLIGRKPANEKWAVLVNEFGERGIDGKIIAQSGVSVKEIPGGCLCCATGLPFQVGLNELVRATRPDRILIEPTGLGHPLSIINILQNRSAHAFISLQSIITLVDPRKLSDERYLAHEHFMEQIEVADVLLGNKADLCSPSHIKNFWSLVDSLSHPKIHVSVTKKSRFSLAWLGRGHTKYDFASRARSKSFAESQFDRDTSSDELFRPESQSWSFTTSQIFSFSALIHWMGTFSSMRLKACLKTDQGDLIFNRSDTEPVSINPAIDLAESIIEIIGSSSENSTLDASLRVCLIP